ncbi:hypothetical protein GALMADRAFT_1326498 [Galerina marginata CBS 339.88]|uniref:Uncharacterized protein n=1 Tax=Galerina marginata (strain CBS 339.88) TaxID=685588 RepID=A0A067T383_GALM3|nr:hypothetical protein GALMADRAFT_1326498 [Galerina marginata CBS 339.88]
MRLSLLSILGLLMTFTSVFSQLANTTGISANLNLPSDPTGLFHFLSDVIAQKAPNTAVELKNASQAKGRAGAAKVTEQSQERQLEEIERVQLYRGAVCEPSISYVGWGVRLGLGAYGNNDGHFGWTELVVIGGAYFTSRDPQNAMTITIVRTPALAAKFGKKCDGRAGAADLNQNATTITVVQSPLLASSATSTIQLQLFYWLHHSEIPEKRSVTDGRNLFSTFSSYPRPDMYTRMPAGYSESDESGVRALTKARLRLR